MARRIALLFALSFAVACSDSPNDDEDTGSDVNRRDVRDDDVSRDTTRDVRVDPRTDVTDAEDDTDDAGDDAADADAGDAADVDATDTSDADVIEGGTEVGPAGARIEFPGGVLIVPAGALADPTVIRITAAPEVVPDGIVLDTDVWRFEPAGLSFERAFEVCFTLDGVRPANTTAFWSARGADSVFRPLPAVQRGGQVCGKTDHFSIGFVGAFDDPDCDGVDCAPRDATCSGDTLLERGLAACSAGQCNYPVLNTNCADAGGECEDGACVALPACGNDIQEFGELCDGADSDGTTCEDLGYTGGTIACASDCTWDRSACEGDPCDRIVCEPAAPRCDGTFIVEQTGGTCDEGDCTFETVRTNCAPGGTCVDAECVDGPGPGDLTITEFMANPNGSENVSEWFEIRNETDTSLALRGMLVADDDSDDFYVEGDVRIEGGAYFVFAASEDAAPTVDYVWPGGSTFQLGNSGDEIVLSFAGTTVDRVAYTRAWLGEEGYSTSLDPEASTNSDSSNWCATLADAYESGEYGTPGTANPTCSTVCGDGNVQGEEQCDDGNTTPDDGCAPDCTVEIDLCDGVSCDDPPDAECDENVAVTYASPGTCDEGECAYVETRTGCGELTCLEGACVRALGRGDLVITEFIPNPLGSESSNEFFEVLNTTDEAIDLRGIEISDAGSDSLFVTGSAPIMVGAGEYFVFARTLGGVPEAGFALNSADGSFALGNSGDEIILSLGGIVIDEVYFDDRPFPRTEGQTTSLAPGAIDADDNDDPANWCLGDGEYDGDGNRGTPGEANDLCPGCGDGVVQAGEECDDGGNDDGDGCAADCTLEPIPDCVEDEECAAPPAAICDGDTVVEFYLPGTCDGGDCSYVEDREDCSLDGGRCVEAACVTTSAPRAGDLIITEFMSGPDGGDANREWFEVTNVSGLPLDLDGLRLMDDGIDDVLIDETLIVPAGAAVVFAGYLADLPDDILIWELPSRLYPLSDEDEILLMDGDTVLDAVRYARHEGWPIVDARSTSLSVDRYGVDDNDNSASWCLGIGAFTDGSNQGTPGALNDSCDE